MGCHYYYPYYYGSWFITHYIWAIYNDLSRGHPKKWWFSKRILQKMALNQVKDL